jgi:F-type H+-transporting ATPase subunit c
MPSQAILGLGLGLPIGLGLAALGAGIGLGLAIARAMEAIGRQPEAANKILVNTLVLCALIEGIFILSWVTVLMLKGMLK